QPYYWSSALSASPRCLNPLASWRLGGFLRFVVTHVSARYFSPISGVSKCEPITGMQGGPTNADETGSSEKAAPGSHTGGTAPGRRTVPLAADYRGRRAPGCTRGPARICEGHW